MTSDSRTHRFPRLLVRLLTVTALALLAAPAALGANFPVTTTADTGGGSLRDAITQANGSVGPHTITFSIACGSTIAVGSALPAIVREVTIDGLTATGGTGDPCIFLDGAGAPGANGLDLGAGSGGSLIRGLAIGNFGAAAGIIVRSDGVRIQTNRIGTDLAGTATAANDTGVQIGDGSAVPTGTIVGTDGDGVGDASEGNLVSGNLSRNVAFAQNVTGNTVAGNRIGTDVTGTSPLFGGTGVFLDGGADSNTIGTDGDGTSDALEGNLISGNSGGGVVSGFLGPVDGTRIGGNRIGVDAAGNALGNSGAGIRLDGDSNVIGVDDTTVGAAAEGNLVSANTGHAIELYGDGNVVAGNLIGTSAAGDEGVGGYGNGQDGVFVGPSSGGSSGTRIGTDADGSSDTLERNVISGNGTGGIEFFLDVRNSTVAGNYVGTDGTGSNPLGNGFFGILLGGGTGNVVGGALPAQQNRIRFNFGPGVSLTPTEDPGFGATLGNTVQGNEISNNSGSGVSSLNTEKTTAATAVGDGPADNAITGNSIVGNAGHGIVNVGSSPSIVANTITTNGLSGVRNEVSFGADTSPATAGDDILSRPAIGGAAAGNTISGNCTAGASNCAGIFSLDTAPSNEATLESDNTPAANGGAPFVEQRWYGALELIDSGSPIGGSATMTSANGGPSYAMGNPDQCSGVLGDTIVHGTSLAMSCLDVTTWTQVVQYVVNSAGTRTVYTPQQANGAIYSFDANPMTHPTNTGAGYNGEGIGTGPYSRYQIIEAPAPPTAVALRSFVARREAARVRLSWRTGAEAGLLGFDVYRERGGRWTKVNRELVRAPFSGSAAGHRYSLLDRRAPAGRVRYRLEAVRLDGTRVTLGFARL